MKNLIIIIIAFIMVSCGSQKGIVEENKDANATLNNEWKLLSIDGIAIGETQKIPQIKFQLEENRFSGNDGCNQVSGSIEEINDRLIKFGPMMGTKMACMDMSVPDKFAVAMASVSSYRILVADIMGGGNQKSSTYLELFNAEDIIVLRFIMLD